MRKIGFLFLSFIDVSRQDRIRAAQKAAVGMNLLTSAMVAASPSLEEAVRSAMRLADEAVARNDIYCVVQVNVGLDTNALREAVMAIMNNQKVSKLPLSLSLSRFEIGRGTEMGLLHSWELDQYRIMLLLIQCLSVCPQISLQKEY